MNQPCINLAEVAAAWRLPVFERKFCRAVADLDKSLLPLQAALEQGNHVGESPPGVTVLGCQRTGDVIEVRAGIFFTGINAGNCCADDPGPVEEHPEYCELVFRIHAVSGETSIS